MDSVQDSVDHPCTDRSLMTDDVISVADWIAETEGVSRSAAYEIFKIIGLEPIKLRAPGSRSASSHLNAEQRHQMDQIAAWIRQGMTMPMLRDKYQTTRLVEQSDAEEPSPGLARQQSSGLSETVQANSPGRSEIVQSDQTTALFISAIEKWQESNAQPVSPLKTARALAEAAELNVPLSSHELAGVVDMSVATVSKWSDGHSPRPGFVLRREKAGNSVWWTVERVQKSNTVLDSVRKPEGAGSSKQVGFATAASLSVIDVQATDCTGSELFSRMTL